MHIKGDEVLIDRYEGLIMLSICVSSGWRVPKFSSMGLHTESAQYTGTLRGSHRCVPCSTDIASKIAGVTGAMAHLLRVDNGLRKQHAKPIKARSLNPKSAGAFWW